MLIFFYIVAAVILGTEVLLIVFWLLNYKDAPDEPAAEPFVSVLIAARNEEQNLGACLESLLAVDYPADKIEILVGNDNSDDQTGVLAEAYAARYPQIRSQTIYRQEIKGNGKANVLAQLARQARGEVLFFTDADIQVAPTWIRSMLGALQGDIALVTGTSVVNGESMFAYIQQMDWLFATGMLKVVSDLGVPVTTMGNNMAIRKKVYDEIGGFESLPFSLTEDLELFKAVKKRYRTINLFKWQVLNLSAPQPTLGDLLEQRKRWMQGAFQLPLPMILLLMIQTGFVVVLWLMSLLIPTWPLWALAAKLGLRYVFLFLVSWRLRYRANLLGSLIFEVFNAVFSILALIYYLIPRPVEWKGRKYEL